MSTMAVDGAPAAGAFLSRYQLPKVALAIISVASLVGTYLTMTVHGATPDLAVLRWLHLLALGALAGGTMWWGFFVPRPAGSEAEAVARFAAAQARRFRAIGRWVLLIVALTTPHLLWFHARAAAAGAQAFLLADCLMLALAVGAAAWLFWRDDALPFDPRPARLTWLALTLALALNALLDARLTFPGDPLAWGLRPIHLVAFGLWVGGAVWNIFVAVPAAQATLAFAVVIAAAEQLERFRWTVRVILPTLFITGLAQALPYVGLDPARLVGTPFGWLILVKLGLVLSLVVVFITCPLWRACSPIRGMCDLEDLAAPARPAPSRVLDNRGKACAGFVQIRQALTDLAPGEVLELLSSDPISWWELPAWLKKHGHHLVEQEQSGRLWWRTYRFLIRKGEAEPAMAVAHLAQSAHRSGVSTSA